MVTSPETAVPPPLREYVLLQAYTAWELETQIRFYLNDRWQLHGTLVTRSDGQLLQAMVR